MAANRNSRVVDSLDDLQSSRHDIFLNPPAYIGSGTLGPGSLILTPRTYDDPAQTQEMDIPGATSRSSSSASGVLMPPVPHISTATSESLTPVPSHIPVRPVLSIAPIGDPVYKQSLGDEEGAENLVMPPELLPQSLPWLYARRASWHSHYLGSSRPSGRRSSMINSHSAFWAEYTPTSIYSSRISVASSEQSWYTALSSIASRSTASFRSANSGQSSFRLRASKSDWQKFLAKIKVAPVEPTQEKDWSGRGEHVKYSPEEESQIPLQLEGVLGHSATALVQSVRCRRIRLAQKTINCYARLKKEDAINEVAHLQRLKHCHIVQVVGTYVCGKKLSILLYPVAEFTLDTYMERLQEDSTEEMQTSFETFFGCLATTMDFMHKRLTKHMDIKPKNLLIKDMGSSKPRLGHIPAFVRYKIIVADFGIARSYASAQESITDSPTSFTRTYASPEVINQAPRSFMADIFSLGCVMLEMLATLCDICSPWHKESYYSGLIRIRSSTSDASYQANALHLIEWLRSSIWQRPISTLSAEERAQFGSFVLLIIDMLNPKPERRPTSSGLCDFFALQSVFPECVCNPSPDPYEAATR